MSTHDQVKEALEEAANIVLVVDGVQLGSVAYTMRGAWTTNADGSVTPPGFTTAFTPSANCTAAISLWKAANATPVSPPPPPPPPTDPTPPTITGQTLTADKDEIRVGDTFTITGTLTYSDGSTAPVKTYAIGLSPKGIVAPTPPGNWITTFVAQAAGAVRIQNSSQGTTGRLDLMVLNADGSAPPSDPVDPPSDPTPPSDPPSDPTPPVTPTLPINDNATHVINVSVDDANGATWAASAIVGNDATVPAQLGTFVDTQGNPHQGLQAKFYANGVDIGACRCDNAYDWLGFKDLTVTYDGQAAPVDVSSNADGTFDFWRGCVFTTRYGKQVGWDASKIDWNLLPNYDRTPVPAYDDSKRDYSFNGLGCATRKGMSSEGDADEIGYLPQWGACFVISPSDASWAVVRRAADHDGKWANMFWVPDTGAILDIETYPTANLLPLAQQSSIKGNPIVPYGGSYRGTTLTPPSDNWHISACPNVPNGAHLTRYAMLAAMITGTARDKDHAAQWANFACIEINPSYTHSGGCMNGIVRRGAWCLASLFMASYVSSSPEYFTRQVAKNLDVANTLMTNPFGLLTTNNARSGKGSAAGKTGLAIWQQSYLMETMDAMVPKLPAWQPFAQWAGKFYALFGALPQTPFICLYVWICIGTDGAVTPDLMQQCRDSMVSNGWTDAEADAVTAPDATSEDVYNLIVAHCTAAGKTWPGKFANGVCDYIDAEAIHGAGNYPAETMMATVAASNVGTPNIEAALARVQNLPTKPDYSVNQKFHLIPRDGTAA